MTVAEALKYGIQRLKNANIDSYFIDCELILSEASGLKKTELFINDSRKLSESEERCFESLLKRRENNEPIAYILGRKEFMGLMFKVNNFTLIPRCDTEVLVEKVIEESQKKSLKSFLDIGTGSGAIAVSLAKYINNAVFDACDISQQALETAKENACINGVADRINFVRSNIYDGIDNKKYDAVISNPPYIKTRDIYSLDKNVRCFEPFAALNGGEDGLSFYRKITEGAVQRLKNLGMIFFEIGFDQGFEVCEILGKNGFENICVLKDLAGLDRVVYAVKPDNISLT